MDILITGASGFIGRNLVEDLSKIPNNKVISMSRKEMCFSKASNIKQYVCDVTNVEDVRKIFKENHFNTVVHLAAITEHDAIVNDKSNTLMTNLIGTKNILDAFNEFCKGAQFVYASTGKVYGATNEMPISENAVCNPTNILGKSKFITERLIDYCRNDSNKYLICRIFNVYGPNQKSNFVIPTIISQLKNESIKLGNIEDKRDYLYISDLVAALRLCIENSDKFENIDYVNIGSGEPLSVRDILNDMESLIQKKIRVEIEEKRKRKDETAIEYCNNSKLIEKTNWHIEYDMKSGLTEILNK